MGKTKEAAEEAGIYRRAKTWQIALSQTCSAAQMTFYCLMAYATYIGNANFGILVAVTGIIVTASRVFDGITDPIVAFIVERGNFKHGKIRTFLIVGWAVMALGTTLMCNIGAGGFSGIAGIVFFVVCYFIYILGYTFFGVASSMIGPILTNDPKQRPTVSVWSTIYSYVAPTVISMLTMIAILPRYGSQYDTPFFREWNIWIIVIALVLTLISCVAVKSYDIPENFMSVAEENAAQKAKDEAEGKDDGKVSVSDMVNLVKNNKEMQRYMVAACSDKLAQTVGSASVISTMLFGIMIGNLTISSIISAVAMFPSIIFAVIGARLAGKRGNMKVMVEWTWACIFLNIVFAAFLFFSDTTQITVAILPTVIFMILTFANSSFKMIVSTATNAFKMDIVDYEYYRSGKYLPASVSATYGFIDKFISAFGATIATLIIGLIGYTTTTPQYGDPLTMGVRVVTVGLYCGFPILGWICTIIGMKNSELTKERMVEVQIANNARRNGTAQ